MELPEWQHLCTICSENLRKEDLEKYQENMCRRYLKKYKNAKIPTT